MNIQFILFLVVLRFFYSECHLLYTSIANNNISVSDSPPLDDGWIAKGYFEKSKKSGGNNYLEIETNSKYSNELQAYQAGYLEGKLTSDIIHREWLEVVDAFSDEYSFFKDLIKNNSELIREQIRKNSDDPHWYQVHLISTQLEGIFDAYKLNTSLPSLEWSDVVLMNFLYVIPDFQNFIDSNGAGTKPSSGDSDDFNASAFTNFILGNSDVNSRKNAWNEYSIMLGTLKKYTLRYNTSSSDRNMARELIFRNFWEKMNQKHDGIFKEPLIVK